LTTNVCNELLWSTNGDGIYVKCLKVHESNVNFFIDKPLVDSTLLHLEVDGDLCVHFSTLTSFYSLKTLIPLLMFLHLHLFLILIVRFFLLYLLL
jgi:hypothetical protein